MGLEPTTNGLKGLPTNSRSSLYLQALCELPKPGCHPVDTSLAIGDNGDTMSKTALPEAHERFKIVPFANQRTGSESWRVTGIKREGTRIRENYADAKAAHCRKVELETEYWTRAPQDTSLRATKLAVRLGEYRPFPEPVAAANVPALVGARKKFQPISSNLLGRLCLWN